MVFLPTILYSICLWLLTVAFDSQRLIVNSSWAIESPGWVTHMSHRPRGAQRIQSSRFTHTAVWWRHLSPGLRSICLAVYILFNTCSWSVVVPRPHISLLNGFTTVLGHKSELLLTNSQFLSSPSTSAGIYLFISSFYTFWSFSYILVSTMFLTVCDCCFCYYWNMGRTQQSY